jgi:hypothetical protein
MDAPGNGNLSPLCPLCRSLGKKSKLKKVGNIPNMNKNVIFPNIFSFFLNILW